MHNSVTSAALVDSGHSYGLAFFVFLFRKFELFISKKGAAILNGSSVCSSLSKLALEHYFVLRLGFTPRK